MNNLAVVTFMAALALTAALSGCRMDPLTGQEAQQALEESAIASQAAALVSASVEVSTDFTIGEAVERAAEEIRDFIHSQLPCAEVELSQATLSITYGALPGNCTFNGHTFEGTHTIAVERNEERDVIVQHAWDGMSNGQITVEGEATVTWSLADRSRHIEHELTWERLADGRIGVGRGTRTQTALEGGLREGIEVDGTRSWDGDSGHWELDIDHVQMRWADPVPSDGSWTLETPFDKTISLEFERVDDDTIGVTVTGGQRSVELKVNRLGLVGRR